MGTKNYWLAFLIGASAGAAVALLCAPQSGAKTRKQLRKGVEEAGDYLEDAGDYLKSQAERFASEAHKAVQARQGSGRFSGGQSQRCRLECRKERSIARLTYLSTRRVPDLA